MSGLEVALRARLGALDLDVAFTTPARGVTALFGPSGSGKSTLLRYIAGLAHTEHGTIRVDGETWQDGSRHLPPHHRAVGYVFQEASLFEHLDVTGNLRFGHDRTPPDQRILAFDEALELFGLGALLTRRVGRLSGGERQRVAITRALLNGPRLLLMDEPLSALDYASKQQILGHLEQLLDRLTIPVLYVTHDPAEVGRLADRVVLLEAGRVVAQGDVAEIATRLDLPLAARDDAEAVLEGVVSAHEPDFHLTWIGTPAGRIAVPRQALRVGRRVRIAVQARDVSLTREPHGDSTILNVLPAEVIDTRERDRLDLTVRLALEGGQQLLARITRRSAIAFGLREGMHVYAQVKALAMLA